MKIGKDKKKLQEPFDPFFDEPENEVESRYNKPFDFSELDHEIRKKQHVKNNSNKAVLFADVDPEVKEKLWYYSRIKNRKAGDILNEALIDFARKYKIKRNRVS